MVSAITKVSIVTHAFFATTTEYTVHEFSVATALGNERVAPARKSNFRWLV